MALPEFNECCFCIDLKSGAYVLGVISCVSTFFGVIELITFLVHFYGITLGLACLTGVNALPAYGFLMLLKDPNSKEKKDQYSDFYLYALCIGSALNFLILLIYGFFLYAIVYTAVNVAINGYFWLCVRSYANAHDRMMQQQPGQVIVVQQQEPMIQ